MKRASMIFGANFLTCVAWADSEITGFEVSQEVRLYPKPFAFCLKSCRANSLSLAAFAKAPENGDWVSCWRIEPQRVTVRGPNCNHCTTVRPERTVNDHYFLRNNHSK